MCNRIGGCSDVETSTTNWILKQSVRDRARTVPRRRLDAGTEMIRGFDLRGEIDSGFERQNSA